VTFQRSDPLEGIWHDRTQEYRYRLRGKEPEPGQFATVETLTLDPLPCWKHLPPEEYRQRIAAMVAEIIEDARIAREEKGVEPLGADAIRRQQPHTRPNRTKKRRRLQGCGREAEGRRPVGVVPRRELPAGPAVRTAGDRRLSERLAGLGEPPNSSVGERRLPDLGEVYPRE
jgi:hypothetical protein